MKKILLTLSILTLSIANANFLETFDFEKTKQFREGFTLALSSLTSKEWKIQGIDEEEVTFKDYMVIFDATDYDDATRFAIQLIGFKYGNSIRIKQNNWIVLASFSRKANATTLAKRINSTYLKEQPLNRQCQVYEKSKNQRFYKEKSFFYDIIVELREDFQKNQKVLVVEKPTIQPIKTPQTNFQPPVIIKQNTTKNIPSISIDDLVFQQPKRSSFKLTPAVMKPTTPIQPKPILTTKPKVTLPVTSKAVTLPITIPTTPTQPNTAQSIMEQNKKDIQRYKEEVKFNKPTMLVFRLEETLPVRLKNDTPLSKVKSTDLQEVSTVKASDRNLYSSKYFITTDTKEKYYYIDEFKSYFNEKDVWVMD